MQSTTEVQDQKAQQTNNGQQTSAPLGMVGKLIGMPLASVGNWLAGQPKHQQQPQQGDQYSSLPDIPRLPTHRRPQFKFDKGEQSLMLSIVDDLHKDSSAAALAMMDFVAQQQGPNAWRAQRHFIAILEWTEPSRAQYVAARSALTEAKSSGDLEAIFTAEVTLREIEFKRWIHGDPTVNRKTLMEQLDKLGYGLAARQSFRRQASVWVMLADLSLHELNFQAANQQMAMALALLAQQYQNRELLELAQQEYPQVLSLTEPSREITEGHQEHHEYQG